VAKANLNFNILRQLKLTAIQQQQQQQQFTGLHF